MTTAHAERSPIDHNVSQVVEILMAYRGLKLKELIVATGIGKSTMIRRRATGGWSADEVARLSAALDAPVSVFYDGAEVLLKGANISRFFPADLAA